MTGIGRSSKNLPSVCKATGLCWRQWLLTNPKATWRSTKNPSVTLQVDELYVQERSEAMSSEKYDMLDGVSAVFFSGGDQLRITSQIGDTPLYCRVKRIFREGGVIAGTSAGASAMGEIMLAKGKSDSSHRLGDLHMAAGLGLVSNVIIDQHFAERGRIGRLIGAVAQNPRMLGIGIDEDTALVLQNNHFEVIGSGAVYIVDASRVSKTNLVEGDDDEPLSVFGITMHILSQGDRFDLAHRVPEMHHRRET